jgi:hypothetical protein
MARVRLRNGAYTMYKRPNTKIVQEELHEATAFLYLVQKGDNLG